MMTIMDRVLVKDNNEGMGFYEQLESQGIHIPESQRKRINSRLSEVLNYEPTVGIFGKTGSGKSSLCNALFGKDICKISDVEACTREKQEILLNMDGNGIKLWDVPGIGENEERDKEYAKLYEKLIPQMDLVLWIVKADDRALASDEKFYKNIVKKYVDEGKPFFIVLNQIDKVEPFRKWDEEGHRPGIEQFQNIHRKINDVARAFDVAPSKVIPISANEKYNLTVLVDEFVRALPNEKKVSFFNAVTEEHQSQETEKEVHRSLIDVALGVASVIVGFAKDIIIEKIKNPIHAPAPFGSLGRVKRFLFE